MAVYGWYRRYVKSNFIALPFAGAWVDQPAWLDHDFRICNLLDQWLADNTPTMADMGGAQGIASDKW